MPEPQALDPIREEAPLFLRPWWLDAVAPGGWAEVVVRRGGKVAARLPYVLSQARGLRTLGLPPLTQFLGPWFAGLPEKSAPRLALEKDLMFGLIDALPGYDVFRQRFHHSVSNWLPFYWRGFEQTTRYTYILSGLDDPDRIWRDFQENVRTDVRKAEKLLVVREDLGVAELYPLLLATFRRRGLPPPWSRALVERVDAACAARGARSLLIAEDAAGRRHAGALIVRDGRTAFYLLGGGDPELRSSGASSLVLWRAIRECAGRVAEFDFEGSMNESIERFFRAFGGVQTPYHQVTKISSLRERVGSDVRSWIRRVRGRPA